MSAPVARSKAEVARTRKGRSVDGILVLDKPAGPAIRSRNERRHKHNHLFPVFSFRFSKSLWLAVDYLINPEPPPLRRVR